MILAAIFLNIFCHFLLVLMDGIPVQVLTEQEISAKAFYFYFFDCGKADTSLKHDLILLNGITVKVGS